MAKNKKKKKKNNQRHKTTEIDDSERHMGRIGTTQTQIDVINFKRTHSKSTLALCGVEENAKSEFFAKGSRDEYGRETARLNEKNRRNLSICVPIAAVRAARRCTKRGNQKNEQNFFFSRPKRARRKATAVMSTTVLLLTAVLVSVALANKDDSNSGRFSWSERSRTTETDGTSSSHEKSTSDSLDSDDLRENRLARDQRRIEVAVQQALLKDRVEPKFPVKTTFTTKSYQLSFTTLLDKVRKYFIYFIFFIFCFLSVFFSFLSLVSRV
jgi:hypothetical protein